MKHVVMVPLRLFGFCTNFCHKTSHATIVRSFLHVSFVDTAYSSFLFVYVLLTTFEQMTIVF